MYNTARTIANVCLQLNGLLPIQSDSQYVTVSQLDKYQLQTALILNLFQQKMGLAMNKRFMYRTFTFPTVTYNSALTMAQNVTSYEVDNVIVEGLRANSFFNVTVGTNSVVNARMEMMTYEMWKTNFPRPDVIAPAFPMFIVPMNDDGSGKTNLMVWPWPNGVYTIEGQCRLIVPPITAGNQNIIFPTWYEHALIAKVAGFLETRLNEGREGDYLALADECVQEVMRDANGANEEQDPLDTGVRLWGRPDRNSARDYYPAIDTAPPWP